MLAAVVHMGESSHHLVLAQALIFLAGGHVAAGTGQECQLDLVPPEEKPVVVCLPELPLVGCREARKG